MLRHPAFISFRTDKPAKQIVREVAMKPTQLSSKSRTSAKGKPESTPPDTIAGVTLTHPDKILYADTGVTKRELAEYYEAVQQWMLPLVVDRPLALVRCPEGDLKKCFSHRNWSKHAAQVNR